MSLGLLIGSLASPWFTVEGSNPTVSAFPAKFCNGTGNCEMWVTLPAEDEHCGFRKPLKGVFSCLLVVVLAKAAMVVGVAKLWREDCGDVVRVLC